MSNKLFYAVLLISVFYLAGCAKAQTINPNIESSPTPAPKIEVVSRKQNPGKVIHVLVALCDNENQGIVPVPAFLGNGEDAAKNLYWGAAFGVKTFFEKSANWRKIAQIENPQANVLQRIVFKHNTADVYLVADAYRGSKMKETINDFLSAAAGEKFEDVTLDSQKSSLQIFGGANLVAFVGHDGLMDFSLENSPTKKDDGQREAIILACASRGYFFRPLQKTGAHPLLWTSNLMAPEAYILHDALDGWINGETDEQIRNCAAAAYAKYQKISLKSARNLLITGW